MERRSIRREVSRFSDQVVMKVCGAPAAASGATEAESKPAPFNGRPRAGRDRLQRIVFFMVFLAGQGLILRSL